jgi:hypothetical protein
MTMNPRVKDVKPNPDHTIRLVFTNGEVRCFDVKPYLDKGIFRQLNDLIRRLILSDPFSGAFSGRAARTFVRIPYIWTACQ